MIYLWLALAIGAELIATSLLRINATSSGINWWLLLGIVGFYSLSFYALGRSLVVIPTGVAYAIWSAVGIVVLTVLDWLIYQTSFTWPVYVALSLIITGVVILNIYSPHA